MSYHFARPFAIVAALTVYVNSSRFLNSGPFPTNFLCVATDDHQEI